MKIEYVKISELNPATYNPRRISEKEFGDLKNSIKKFGIVDPAIVNQHPGRENTIVGGHQRIRAAIEMGMKEFPCFYVNLTEKDERELNVRLNKNTGKFDFDILANEFDVGDLMEWGFTDKDFGLADVEDFEPSLPEGDKEGMVKVSFTFTQEQANTCQEAIKKAGKNNPYDETGENSNKNGNAMAFICGAFIGKS